MTITVDRKTTQLLSTLLPETREQE